MTQTPIEAPEAPEAARTHCGIVALIGAPNAGKSTLVNALVGVKVSIVTHKVQTTRALVRGIMLEGDSQVILVDTPGIFPPKRRLDRAMVRTAWGSAQDADLVCPMIDAKRGIDESAERMLQGLENVHGPKCLILNKVDLVEKTELLGLAQEANARAKFDETFMISAQNGSGIAHLKSGLCARMPAGPWLYPEDQISDLPERMLAAEITREKLMLRLHDEVPYASTVETEQWKRLRDKSVRIEQTIYVERESQKKIVLGQGGQAIRSISQAARAEISQMIERPVHLFLFVKVRSRWSDDPERFREMGLDFSN